MSRITRQPPARLAALLVGLLVVSGTGCTPDDRPRLDDAAARAGAADEVEPVFADQLTIDDDTVEPSRLFVGAARPLTIRNGGSEDHTVTAWDGTFDVRLAAGQQLTITAPEPGNYPFGCTIHPELQGDLETR